MRQGMEMNNPKISDETELNKKEILRDVEKEVRTRVNVLIAKFCSDNWLVIFKNSIVINLKGNFRRILLYGEILNMKL